MIRMAVMPLVVSLGSLIGCSQFSSHVKMQPVPPPDLAKAVMPDDIGSPSKRPIVQKITRYRTNLSNAHCPDGSTPSNDKICADGKPLLDNFKRERNEILQSLQAEIDEAYHNYSRSMFAGNAYFGVASDLAVIGLSGAGAVVGSSDLQAILAAASGGVTGASASISKQFFNQQSVLSVVAAMDASRAQKYLEIVQQQAKDIYGYPLDAGIVDIADYFSRGTLLSGLQWIQATAGQTKIDSQKETVEALRRR